MHEESIDEDAILEDFQARLSPPFDIYELQPRGSPPAPVAYDEHAENPEEWGNPMKPVWEIEETSSLDSNPDPWVVSPSVSPLEKTPVPVDQWFDTLQALSQTLEDLRESEQNLGHEGLTDKQDLRRLAMGRQRRYEDLKIRETRLRRKEDTLNDHWAKLRQVGSA